MFSLTRRHFAGAYNPDVLAAVGMSHNQEPTGVRYSDGDKPLFHDGVIRVMICQCQGMAKDRRRFVEGTCRIRLIKRHTSKRSALLVRGWAHRGSTLPGRIIRFDITLKSTDTEAETQGI